MAPPLGPAGSGQGFWGPPTSTIDWCEANYEVTILVAEFWNTISNLMFIIPPLAAAYHFRNKLDGVYQLSLLYMAFTGLGSCAFHGTLLYSMQLWDELSMVWSGLFILYLIIRIFKGDDESVRYIVPLIVYGIGTCTVYLSSNTPVIFQIAYGVIHFSIVILAYQLKKSYPMDMRLYWGTVLMSSAGFLLWNIDNNMCPSLEQVRASLRSSSASVLVPVTQFHALWHCLAGYGAFCMVLYVIQARLFSLHKVFTLSLAPLSGLTLEQVHTEGAETLMTSGQRYADEDEIVTPKDSPSPGTVRLISNAVTSGYSQLVKSYNNRKRD